MTTDPMTTDPMTTDPGAEGLRCCLGLTEAECARVPTSQCPMLVSENMASYADQFEPGFWSH